jgi:spore coat polysaccharide biosynthesis protein SpsF (cytidylyltransferase family)
MNILAIIQCRLGSQRFPNKALAHMADDRPIITHVLERARRIAHVDDVVIATPKGADLRAYGPVIMPDVDERDVLGRFASVAAIYPANVYVRITADCPLLQPDVCGRLITEWRKSSCDYGWLDTHTGIWPDGLDCEVFTRDLLMQAHMQATEAYDREHVTSIMRRMRTPFSLPADSAYNDWPKVSIDTPEDLERVREFSRRTVVA